MWSQLIPTELPARRLVHRLALTLLALSGAVHAHAGEHERLVTPTITPTAAITTPTMVTATTSNEAPQRANAIRIRERVATEILSTPAQAVEAVALLPPGHEITPSKAAFPVAPPVVPTPVFSLRIGPQDERVSRAMRQFAMQHGWALSWEIDRDFPILYEAQFEGGVLEIVAQIAHALQNLDAPIRVKAYHANKVMRVLYATY